MTLVWVRISVVCAYVRRLVCDWSHVRDGYVLGCGKSEISNFDDGWDSLLSGVVDCLNRGLVAFDLCSANDWLRRSLVSLSFIDRPYAVCAESHWYGLF